jgi:hypothetical protein
MKTTVLMAALLAGGILAASPAGAQSAGTQEALKPRGGTEQGATGQGAAGAGAAVQGGIQGDCPEGQVRSANGACAPGQPGAAAMPASPHQQELLRGQQGNEPKTPQQ